MSNEEKPDTKEVQENAPIGYQCAVSLWVYEGQVIWARFNAMLLGHSILLAVLTGLLTSSKPTNLTALRVGLCFAGVLLCLVWLFLTDRGFRYHAYWIGSARKLEKHIEPVRTALEGHGVAGGAPTVRTLSYFTVFIFLGLYFLILALPL